MLFRSVITNFALKSDVIQDEVQAGGRIPLIIGRGLTKKAREALKLPPSDLFKLMPSPDKVPAGWTLAQKLVGKACGRAGGAGVAPGEYCEPAMGCVGSQDTTGPMTRDELKDLACLGFSADLTMQSFCHTAAYPKPVDVITHRTLPKFIAERGGVALRPGDGIIHSWLNRMLLPDQVGTGGDSHTRFPLGISFPAGSGLVAFAAATGASAAASTRAAKTSCATSPPGHTALTLGTGSSNTILGSVCGATPTKTPLATTSLAIGRTRGNSG